MARFTSPDANGAPGPMGPTGPTGPGVPAGGDAGNILAKIDGTDYNTEWIQNYTSTVKHQVKYVGNPTIPVGTPVYAVLNGNGNSSTNIPVNIASNTSEATSSKTMGLVEASVAKNGFVYVVTEGLVDGIDTSTANTGDPVWLGVDGAYIFGLANKPKAPAHLVFLGVVTRGQQVNGEIFVKVQNGFELDELHTVNLESSIADKEVLAFDSASGLWKNQTAAEAGLATSAPLTLSQSGNHASYPLTISSANQQGGGTGYADILKITNTVSGATSPNKFVRMSNSGNLEILNNTYDAVNFLISDAGDVAVRNNITANGFIRGNAAGSVLKDTMLSNSELNIISTTIAQTTSNVNFITYNYTPVSSSSYLMIHFHLSKYTVPGSIDDSYFSILAVDGSEISYGYQNFNDDAGGSNNRSGVLFPLMGRYTNSSTSSKQIQLAARRISADDSITIDNSGSAIWLRITEVAR